MRHRYAALVFVVCVACSAPGQPSSAPPAVAVSPRPSPSQTEPKNDESWRKDRYIAVHAAADRLRRHVDAPFTLPRDSLGGIRGYKGWLADPRYLDWARRSGERVGTLVLRKKKDILWVHVGYASPDGCGGRDTAIRTDVRGAPALVWLSPGHVWSRVVWPVTPRAHTGTYGLSGTFEGWQLIRLAESMDTGAGGPGHRDAGC